MTIIRFAAVAGTILLALLFVANATLKPRGPLFTNNSEGLPRSEPARPQQAQRTPETPRQRAPTPVQTESSQPEKPVAPHIAQVAEAVEPPPVTAPTNIEIAKSEAAKAEVPMAESAKTEQPKTAPPKTEAPKTETSATEPAKTESAQVETAKLEAATAEPAKSETAGRETVTAVLKATQRRTPRTTHHKARKTLARKNERGGRYNDWDSDFAQDDAPAVENGYGYGVAPRRQRSEWQRPWGGDFDENRNRF